jgi:predicted anti-sigma-YlaC factor YlaD
MTCDQVKPLLWEFYDQALAPDQRLTVERHLDACPDCRRALDQWMSLSRAAFSRPPATAPAFLWTRIFSEIRSRQEAGAWWAQWRWMGRVATALALAVAVAAGTVLYQDDKGNALEGLLQGIVSSQQAAQLAEAARNGDQVAALLDQPPADETGAPDRQI